MRGCFAALLLLMGAGTPTSPATTKASTTVVLAPTAKKVDVGAIEKRFVELRDDPGLRCLLDRRRSVIEAIVEQAPPIVVRIAAFAMVERARRNGDSPLLDALQQAIIALAKVDDIDGLRLAFEEVDRVPRAADAFFWGDEIAYRARVGLPMRAEDQQHHLLAVIRELALAGEVKAATALYDDVKPNDIDDDVEVGSHVAALAALGRIERLRSVIQQARPENRAELTARWLNVAIRKGDDPKLAVEATLTQLSQAPATRFGAWVVPTLRIARIAGLAAEVSPLRKRAIAGWKAEDWTEVPGHIEKMYQEVLAVEDVSERKALEAIIPLGVARHLRSIYNRPLLEAVTEAKSHQYPEGDLARVWVSYLQTGALDRTFAVHFAAAVCPPARRSNGPPTPPKRFDLRVAEQARAALAGCAGTDTLLQLKSGAKVVDQHVFKGDCHGYCTADEKQKGQARLNERQDAVASGKASPSVVDYNFTECQFGGVLPGRIDRVGGRDVALLAEQYIGAHDIKSNSYRIALEICSRVFVSSEFGRKSIFKWSIDDLSIHQSEDRSQIVVSGNQRHWRGVVFRLELPACPSKPTEWSVESGG